MTKFICAVVVKDGINGQMRAPTTPPTLGVFLPARTCRTYLITSLTQNVTIYGPRTALVRYALGIQDV